MRLAFVTPELLTLIAVIVLLLGVPLFVVAVLAVASGYVRARAERELEAAGVDVEAATVDEKDGAREDAGADAVPDDREHDTTDR